MPAKLHFVKKEGADTTTAEVMIVIGQKESLLANNVKALLPTLLISEETRLWDQIVDQAAAGATAEAGGSSGTWVTHEHNTLLTYSKVKRVFAGVVPSACSRHNCPARPDVVTEIIRKNVDGKSNVVIVLAITSADQALAVGCAAARAFPLYTRKEGATDRDVFIEFRVAGGNEESINLEKIAIAAESVRLAARLVDTPTSELNTDTYIEEVTRICKTINITPKIIRGEDLAKNGFGGLWGVGKAATHKPAMVILSHTPKGDDNSNAVVWVGKGIVYDCGGLSLKPTDSMCGMKRDMGGSAGVFAAFVGAVQLGYNHGNLHAILCLAENSIGPDATRNDDIITLYSGKTVEINNTDAEGRLVLADGVAYATKHLSPAVILDMATLTGAQGIATGKKHAAVVTNDEDMEVTMIASGKKSGDLVHPLPYCPEFFKKEFTSAVADMKNSVKDRANAQSSCAAQFVANHLNEQFTGKWVHVDMAYPVYDATERATGYGVALLLQAFASQYLN